MREGCDGGGKGPLISEDVSLTLAGSNDQYLFLADAHLSTSPGVNLPGRGGEDDANLIVADTVRSHPRPGSNSIGNLAVARCVTASGKRLDGESDTLILDDQGGSQMSVSYGSVGTLRSQTHGNLPIVLQASAGHHGHSSPRGDGSDNLVTVIKGAAIGRAPENGPQRGEILTDSTSYTLNTAEVHAIQRGLLVRRLTPRECERLMSYPDDWTRWTDDGQEIPDTHRYRMCGNGVVSNVAEWIARRLLSALEASDVAV